MVRIKNAHINDIEAMVALLEQLFTIEKDFSFQPDLHARGLALMLDGCGKHRIIKTAWVDDVLKGMCSAQTRISTAHGGICAVLEDLVVDRAFRGNGIGSALLESVEQWAAQRDIRHLSLLADRHNNPAISFYKTKSWEKSRMISLTKEIVL